MEYWLSLSCPDVIRWVLYRKKRINYRKFPVTTEDIVLEANPLEAEKQRVREMLIKMYLFHRTVSHNKDLRKKVSAVFSNNLLNMLLGALGGIK
ncbi:MAG: hypothetical protein FWB91_01485 [Defluviitaleaceae bacterium]|nr:hypothetical protein [Defluviitaleaceae bacterium]